MIKAAFFDVDGTLLSHATHCVPKSARESLEKLRSKGIKTYLCTGRHMLEFDFLPMADIPFDGYITLNGHLCLDANKQLLCDFPFPEDTVRALIARFKEHHLPLLLVEENGMTLNFVNDTVIRAQKAISSPIPNIAPYDGKPIYLATAYVTPDEDDLIRSIIPSNCHIARWNDRGIDLILNDVGKVAGIRTIPAAVVRPVTLPPFLKIIPAPRKPTPLTTCAARRAGSAPRVPLYISFDAEVRSAKPYLETIMIRAAPAHTIM